MQEPKASSGVWKPRLSAVRSSQHELKFFQFCIYNTLASNPEKHRKAKAGNIWVGKSICLSSSSCTADMQFSSLLKGQFLGTGCRLNIRFRQLPGGTSCRYYFSAAVEWIEGCTFFLCHKTKWRNGGCLSCKCVLSPWEHCKGRRRVRNEASFAEHLLCVPQAAIPISSPLDHYIQDQSPGFKLKFCH